MSAPYLFQIFLHDIQAQIINIKLHLPASKEHRVLRLPNWIPGSYMIRDFAQHVHRESAETTDGHHVSLGKVNKSTWLLAPSQSDVTISYAVFANDLSIRSAFINDQYVFMNGTSVFMQVLACDAQGQVAVEPGIQDQQPYHVQIIHNARLKLANWKISTSMQAISLRPLDTELYFGEYAADSYADLIDHPFVIGALDEHHFMVGATKFTMMFTEKTALDPTILMADMQKICEHHFALWGDIPFKHYIFQTLVAETGYGGLEHNYSTALLYPRAELNNTDPTKREGYETFLSLCAHELLHAWLVKRIQPSCLQSPTLQTEINTPQLWIYEGFTSLYDDASLLRSGVITEAAYLKILGQNITRLLRNPGRFDQSIAASSFDAWTKFYQQKPTSTQFITSYYNKGGIVALCLDIVLRQLSSGKVSLDDVLRVLWTEYGKTGLGTDDSVIEDICQTHFGLDVTGFLQQAVHSSMELPLPNLLADIGLELTLRASSGPNDKGGSAAEHTAKYAFGANYSKATTGVTILSVYAGSPAHDAGCLPGDNIIAINGWQVNFDTLQSTLDRAEFSAEVPVTLFRDGRLITVSLLLRDALKDTAVLNIVDPEKFKAWYKRKL